jgi:Glucodextranase, domain B
MGCLSPRRVATDLALAVVVLAALGGSAPVSAQTVTLPAVASTTLKKASPNQSFGGQTTLVVRPGGSRVLVRFDPAAIAAAVGGGSLASAELQLYIGTNGANWGPTGRTLDLYRIDAAWTEAAATWNCPSDANLANAAPDCAAQWSGGATEDEASDTVVVTNAVSGWIRFDVTADVLAFLAGTENDGWLLRKTDESQTGRVDLVSRQGAAAQAPRLVLLSESATVDTVPPSLAVVSPAQPVLVNVPSPPIAVAYHDGGSGVDLSTLHVLLDGQDLTAACTVGAAAASCTPPALAAGPHTIAASLSDHAGNAATATASFALLLGPSIHTLTFPVAADTYLNGRAADREHGRAAFLRVAKSGPSRALLGFAPAALLQALGGSQLLSAELELSIAGNGQNWGVSGRTVGAYRLTEAWSEAAATWDCPADSNLGNDQPDCGAPWNGGAFVASPTATALVTRHLAGTVLFDVTADVAAFLTGTTNAGWLVGKTDELASGRVDFVSREASAGQPAQLVVVVQVPPVDTTPPVLTITSPSQPLISDPQPPIAVAYSDSGSGVDTGTLAVTLDGAVLGGCTVGPSAATCSSPILAPGAHLLAAALRDRAGNAASASLAFEVSALPLIAITSPADGSFFRSASIQVTGTLGGPVASVTVNGQAATLGPGSFTANLTLAPGANPLVAVATDAAGNQGSATIAVTLDTQPPVLTLTTPAPGSVTNQPQVTVAGTVTDDFGVASLTVAGQPVAVGGGSFTLALPVAEGANTIEVDATDLAGNVGTATVTVTRFSVPEIVITEPPDLSFVTGTTLAVGGTVTDAVSVSVNGVAAAVSGTSFSATGVPLVEGGNTVTATATDGAGHVGTATINVVRDLTPPHVAIYTPAAGSTIADSTVTVSGLVNDIVAGTVNAGEVRVSVNGLAATVANRSFVVLGVPLVPGDNVLTASAVDASGNQGQASITVRQAAPAAARVAIVSGSGQTAVIRMPLPQPLVAAVLDATGQPVPGKPVLFRVRDGDGTLDGGRRDVAVTSDANGQAAAHLVLGSRAGAGSQVVEASSPGYGAPAVFLGSALPGVPALIVVDSGDQQLGVAGQALPRPLVAAVVDAGGNRLPGVAATLGVVKGAGHFGNGQQTLGLTTDSDGRLIAALTTDPAEGVANNVVEATIDGLAGGPVASFVASTWAAGDPAQTAVSGVVLDNTNLPVAGVTLRLRDTALTAVTDDQGLFTIAAAPVGTLKLIVDGSTAQRPGAWPDLEFDLTTVPGRTNTLRMPIYLLPLDLANGIQVDETHGGTLRLAQLPGFALDIQPGSVTFPGGGRSGLLSVTVVHSDKVPMVPNFGQQPRLIVTIQPAGARFDPPARLTLPNVEGLAPGQVTEFYSFDHDLGHFVSIGPGTVSDDGSVVTSNVGVGIVKSGWHCCGFPQGSGAPNSCPDCTVCTGNLCTTTQICSACKKPPTARSVCSGGGTCVAATDLAATLFASGLIQIPIGGQQQLQRTDLKCTAACFGAFKQTFGPLVVKSPCTGVDFTGAVLEEEVLPISTPNPCPGSPGQISSAGCEVKGNQLVSIVTKQPCVDVQGFCGAPVVPLPGPSQPPYVCTYKHSQEITFQGETLLTRTATTTITETAQGCTVTNTTQ